MTDKKQLTRAEKIQLIRGLIQTAGLIIAIAGMAWMIKNFNDRQIMGECVYVHADGTEEHTGLYGNCTWYDAKINDYYEPNRPHIDEDVWELHNRNESPIFQGVEYGGGE